MQIQAAASTHTGCRREHNEDRFLLADEDRLYVVADGMGGEACGEIAAEMSVTTVLDFFQKTGTDPEATWPCRLDRTLSYPENRLIAAIQLANRRVWERAQVDSRMRRMGTTIAGALFHDRRVSVAHVGDSRVYRLRRGLLELLTEDHTLLNFMLRTGQLRPDEAERFAHRNIIARAVGTQSTVEVDLITQELEPGDIYLICSDGLTGELSDERIQTVLSTHQDALDAACDQLVAEACAHGGRDNVTVVLAKVR
jgi:protein phosphatase